MKREALWTEIYSFIYNHDIYPSKFIILARMTWKANACKQISILLLWTTECIIRNSQYLHRWHYQEIFLRNISFLYFAQRIILRSLIVCWHTTWQMSFLNKRSNQLPFNFWSMMSIETNKWKQQYFQMIIMINSFSFHQLSRS